MPILSVLPLALGCLLAIRPVGAEPPRPLPFSLAEAPRIRIVQRLDPRPEGPVEELQTEHFEIRYRPAALSRAKAEEAARIAEAAWVRCRERFGEAPAGKLRLDLTPAFIGATGYALRPNPRARQDAGRRWSIGVRYPELDYLGLSPEYVLTHEIAHAFSGDLAGGPLAEGIADWAAGGFSGQPMRPWWGAALRSAGLWIDPTALFVTGEFRATPEVDAVSRTALYVETGLLVQFLVERFTWPRTKAFAEEYGAVRGPLNSNEDRRAGRVPPGFPTGPGRPVPRRPPDADAVRAVFEKHFGESWERLLSEWERTMAAEPPPRPEADRLVLAQRIYGAIRNYEMWLASQPIMPPTAWQDTVREAFTRANGALRAGDLPGAAAALDRARALVERLRRPRIIARGIAGKSGATARTFAASNLGGDTVRAGPARKEG